MISGCESLKGKTLTIDYEDKAYYIGDRVIPFSSCIIKDGRIYYLTPMSQVLLLELEKLLLIQLFVQVTITVIVILSL